MAYRRNNVIVRVQNTPPENNRPKAAHIDYLKLATILGSIIAFVFSVYTFMEGQEIIDKRKYNNAFFDERYRVLKEITKSISEVDNLISFDNSDFSLQEQKELTGKLSVFKYANLVMDREKKDSVLLNMLNDYEVKLLDLLQHADSTDQAPGDLSKLGDAIIIQCGKILNNEKDSINSVRFRFFPFRQGSSAGKQNRSDTDRKKI